MEWLPDVLEGEGLVLRRWTIADAVALEEFVTANIEHLRPYMSWIAAEPVGLDGRRKLIAAWDDGWRGGQDAVYAVLEPEVNGDVAVAGTGAHRRIGPGGVEIGYWVDHRHLGRAIARRSSALLTRAAFEVDDVDHVEIHHDLTNEWSRRVPEHLGFELVNQTSPDRPLAPAEAGIELQWRMGSAAWAERSAP